MKLTFSSRDDTGRAVLVATDVREERGGTSEGIVVGQSERLKPDFSLGGELVRSDKTRVSSIATGNGTNMKTYHRDDHDFGRDRRVII